MRFLLAVGRIRICKNNLRLRVQEAQKHTVRIRRFASGSGNGKTAFKNRSRN
jgi:hypothetical protein